MTEVFVVTIGGYRSDVGEYTMPEVYTTVELADEMVDRLRAGIGQVFERDETAEDIGGDHVLMAWSNRERTRTIWLERLAVRRELPKV